MNFLWRTSIYAPNLIRQALVVAHYKPIFFAIGSACLQNQVQLLDEAFRQLIFSMVDDIIDTTEVVHCFYDIIHVDSLISDSNGVCLKDVSRLVVS